MSAVITKTAGKDWMRVVANGANIAGLPCDDSTLNVCNILTVDNQMNNVDIILNGGRKIVIDVGDVSDIGGVIDLDTTMKIRNALITLLES